MQTKQKQGQTFALRIERTIAAPRARVFEAFTNPDDLSRDATRVVMLHEGFIDESSRNGHREGWSSCFDRLERMFA